jgi:ubiquinone/menaquinone biosynthesis C-methylase UbiE
MRLSEISSYWDRRAAGYSLTIHQQLCGEVGAFFRRALKDSAPAGENLRCLDIGCGPGFFSILLAQEGHTVTAVDYSEGMLKEARANFEEMGVAAATQQGDAQNLPFPDESFDYIVSRNLVWNLEHPEKAYQEWLRLLRPGGRLFVSDGNHYLHYYDKDYLEAKQKEEAAGKRHDCHGVDPTPINEIARDLPLSRVHRPTWDIEQLFSLGLERIDVQVTHRTHVHAVTGEEKSLISDFILWGEKPDVAPKASGDDEQEKINAHWSKASDNYSRIIHHELESFRAPAWVKRITENAPQKDVLDVLDAGCGPGIFSILLAREGHRVVGLDGAEGMLRHAADTAQEYGVSPLFIQGDCHALPFVDDSFDLVISRNVTHALRDHKKVYAEWHRVLRPGGRLLIFDANWHLLHCDEALIEEFSRREEECFRLYGSGFSAGGRRESEEYKKRPPHRLGSALRPQWDVPLLKHAGFTDVFYEENIIEGLWDDKEKLLYGATPMFMISATKK